MNKDIPVFNPLSKDIEVKYDTSGPNPRSWLLRAKEITMVESLFAKHIKRTLADAVFDKIGDYCKDRDPQMKDIYEKISPKI